MKIQLSKPEKIKLFKYLLLEEKSNYADVIREDIYFYFFESENDPEFKFLDKMDDAESISKKLDFVVSKIIMHEDDDRVEELIWEYLYTGTD
ncbi:MAG: hypothetical protein JNJ99_08235 [Crocinitomicaceae bacterium]|nr:hypothetical protein [Crocinitomicaceae bacterium]